jgi:hypothetical protein
MTLATLRRTVKKMRAALRPSDRAPRLLDGLRADPAVIFKAAGMVPDQWQEKLLRSRSSRMLLLCSRQSGKSQTAAALALREALLWPPALVLLLSPTLRQSGELFKDKVRRLYHQLGKPVDLVQETQLTMELANGSRIVSLPGEESTIRGYSGVRLPVIDEAARVPDALYFSVRPMLAVSQGQLVAMSTPFGKRGWFYGEWRGGNSWERVAIRADQCPRITPQFLAEERAALGEHWFCQEYMLEFRDVIDALFRQEDIDAALNCDIKPLNLGACHAGGPAA